MKTEINASEVRIGINAIAGGVEIGVSYTVMQLWLAGKVRLYGIPLTEQHLIDFGFEKLPFSFSLGRIHITKQDHSDLWWTAFNANNAHINTLKYVHQLQTLYCDLHQTDLSIQSKTEQ